MKHFSLRWLILFGLLSACVGCGVQAEKTFENVGSEIGSADGERAVFAAQQGPDEVALNAPVQVVDNAKAAQPQQAGAGNPKADVDRKIEYNAEIHTIVKDFDKSKKELFDLIKATDKAFRSNSSIEGQAGQRQNGTFTIRVPVKEFEEFCEGVSKIGSVVQNTISSKDRTVEYYDLEGRIKAKEKLIQELEKFYETSKDTKDTLKVYQEIKNEKTDLEGMKSRFLALQNVTSMSTVTVRLIADEHYVPPQPRTFGESIGSTFWTSINAMLWLGRGLVLIVVAIVPWLPLIALFVLLGWFLNRKVQQSRPTTVTPTTPESPGEG